MVTGFKLHRTVCNLNERGRKRKKKNDNNNPNRYMESMHTCTACESKSMRIKPETERGTREN